ncbi:MAG TPA: right-handed parallel beta-helix repeat-containing protein [Chloroflexota bacterium]|nr:right-handed parallel beta-helix repeat-containing protein [Chloroflexota bacterium]
MILQPGSLFAGYRVDRLLGSGAMGVVNQGHDLTLDRAVAIKVLSMILVTPEDTERFRVEARVLARFNHPHILPVFTCGVEQGMPYLVTPMASGGTLAAWLGKGPVRPENVVHVLRPIAEALDYVHAAGVVHRDVKPQNILLDERGRPLLADFGVAKLLSGAGALTATGDLLGTPAYMAPEYVYGTPVTPATDRYALAVVAYELLVGGQPYQGQTGIQQLLAHANGPLPQPRQTHPTLSPALEEMLLHGLARDPVQRFATAARFIDEIETALGQGSLAAAGRSPIVLPNPDPGVARVRVDGTGTYPDLETATRLASPGTTILLDAGLHRLQQALVVRQDLTLIGAGKESTIIGCAKPGYVVRFEGPGQFAARDLTFEHQGDQVADTVVVVGGTVLLERCRFDRAIAPDSGELGGVGLRLGGSASGVVRESEAANNQMSGIFVDELSSPTLEANLCARNRQSGIAFFGKASGTARQNICRENEFGITVAKQSLPTLEANTCERNKGCGIAYFDSAAGAARQNVCRENDFGIFVTERARPLLDANICERNTGSGLAYFDQAMGCACRNTCRENEGAGIYLDGQAQPTLQANICERNYGGGIQYFDTASGTALQNICRDNQADGIAVAGQARPLLEENTCEGNTADGIYYYGSATGLARRNLCRENELFGILVQECALPVLEVNVCERNLESGVGYTDSAGGTARQNTCRGNGAHGIAVARQARPVLEGNNCRGNRGRDIFRAKT